nr:hypothetical protein [Lactococcus fujiensis]
MALITPNCLTNSVWQSFLIHMRFVTYVLMRLIGRDFCPNRNPLWRVFLCLLAIVSFISILNQLWQQNFIFLEIPAPGTPLEPNIWLRIFIRAHLSCFTCVAPDVLALVIEEKISFLRELIFF